MLHYFYLPPTVWCDLGTFQPLC
uniref:Uncharacterized protein n=1 Tax=Arundo donax TaxID=35708 RepID=A0A0A9BNM5_ARUDO